MIVEELIEELKTVDPKAKIAIQKNYPNGGYSLYDLTLQKEGHIGFDGLIIHENEANFDAEEGRGRHAKKSLPHLKTGVS